MQLLACQGAFVAFVAWVSVVPWHQVEASVELVLVAVVVAVVEVPVGLAEAFPVAAAVVAVVVVVVVVAAVAVAADTDSCSPTDDNIQPTGLCSPVVQQQWSLLQLTVVVAAVAVEAVDRSVQQL